MLLAGSLGLSNNRYHTCNFKIKPWGSNLEFVQYNAAHSVVPYWKGNSQTSSEFELNDINYPRFSHNLELQRT